MPRKGVRVAIFSCQCEHIMFSPDCASSNAGQCVLFGHLPKQLLNSHTEKPFTPSMRHPLFSLLLVLSSQIFAQVDTTPQSHVDMDRYYGRWYEQARYENWFEEGLEKVYADYVPLGPGQVQVTNYGTNQQGELHKAGGRAFVKAPGELAVSFVWPYWWFHAPYKILYITPEYDAALVSGEGEDYLWLLTRKEQVSPRIMRRLEQEAEKRGFDTSRLLYTQNQKRKSTAPDTNRPG